MDLVATAPSAVSGFHVSAILFFCWPAKNESARATVTLMRITGAGTHVRIVGSSAGTITAAMIALCVKHWPCMPLAPPHSFDPPVIDCLDLIAPALNPQYNGCH